METVLPSNQTYDAVLRFLKKMHNELGWKHLGALLGSMSLIDGVPMDMAIKGDWSEVFDPSLCDRGENLDALKLKMERAYIVMFRFLEKAFEARREDIGVLIYDMTLVDDRPRNESLMELWKSAVSFVESGGVEDSYIIVKDGVSHQVRRDK